MRIEEMAGFEEGGRFRNKSRKHPYFDPEFGDMEVTPWYANNETFSLEIHFSVPASEWNEFQSSSLFQELNAKIRSFRRKTQDTNSDNYVQKLQQEIQMCAENSILPDCPKSFWDRVHTLFQKQKYR